MAQIFNIFYYNVLFCCFGSLTYSFYLHLCYVQIQNQECISPNRFLSLCLCFVMFRLLFGGGGIGINK